MIRKFNTWNYGVALISITLIFALGSPWCWVPLGGQFLFSVGMVVGRWVVNQ